MPWAKIDDDAPSHPKFLSAGSIAAFGFWVAGNCYCNKRLTDGFIAESALTLLSPLVRMAAAKKYAEDLVRAGLWEPTEGGYRVHDFHVYNPTSASVKADRAAAAARKDRWKERRSERRSERQENAVPPVAGTDAERRSAEIWNGVRNDAHARASTRPDPAPTPQPPSRSGNGWPAEMFNRDCADVGWRGSCVSASWLADHPGEPFPSQRDGSPKQCPEHRGARV